jgi:putative transposase
MPNHVHLLVTPSSAGAVAALMQALGRRYVRLFNEIHGRSGTLWEGRYKSSLIDSETYLLTCHRYIDLNPVRAGLVRDPQEFRWSSHRHYRLGERNPIVTRHPVFDALAADEPARQGAFEALFREKLTEETIGLIRKSANQGWALGSEQFLDRIEVALGKSARPPKRGRPFKQTEEKRSLARSEMLI